MRTPRYGVSRVMGAETEYGVIAPAAPGTNPTILSAMVVRSEEHTSELQSQR